MKVPFIESFRATNLFKAFLINAFISALVATIIVEVRQSISVGKGKLYNSIREIFNAGNPWNDELSKVRSTFIIGFLVTLILYNLLYLLIAYGGVMLTPGSKVSYF